MCTLLEFQSCCDTGNVNIVIFAIYFHGSFSPHGILKHLLVFYLFVSFSFVELEIEKSLPAKQQPKVCGNLDVDSHPNSTCLSLSL